MLLHKLLFYNWLQATTFFSVKYMTCFSIILFIFLLLFVILVLDNKWFGFKKKWSKALNICSISSILDIQFFSSIFIFMCRSVYFAYAIASGYKHCKVQRWVRERWVGDNWNVMKRECALLWINTLLSTDICKPLDNSSAKSGKNNTSIVAAELEMGQHPQELTTFQPKIRWARFQPSLLQFL